MKAIPIGTFTLGGSNWSIQIDNDFCDIKECIFCVNSSLQLIKIKDTFNTTKLPYDNVLRIIWDAILTEVVTKTMGHRGLNTTNLLSPYSSFLYQATKTLTSKPEEWDGSFEIGGKSYIVKVDNNRASNENWYGMCCYNEGIIYLATGDEDVEYIEDFIYQTLWHEILHAIAYELGRSKEKINSEKFVNTLATFVYEIIKTLKINFPDESD